MGSLHEAQAGAGVGGVAGLGELWILEGGSVWQMGPVPAAGSGQAEFHRLSRAGRAEGRFPFLCVNT